MVKRILARFYTYLRSVSSTLCVRGSGADTRSRQLYRRLDGKTTLLLTLLVLTRFGTPFTSAACDTSGTPFVLADAVVVRAGESLIEALDDVDLKEQSAERRLRVAVVQENAAAILDAALLLARVLTPEARWQHPRHMLPPGAY
jgi:hypothetical protein